MSIDVDAQQTLIVEMYLSSGGGQNIHLKRLFDGDEDGGPAVIDVTISLDGQAIGVGHYEPEYTVREPNGVGCGTVTQASDTLLVNTLSLW